MLPGSTPSARRARPRRGKQSGRTQEIQRLIGRSLRAVTDLAGARRAPGHGRLRRAAGRRRDAHRVDQRRLRRARTTRCTRLVDAGPAADAPADRLGRGDLASGSWTATPMLDLPYEEDSRADVDMNVVMTGVGTVRRGAGHRRERAVLARRARHAARPGRRGDRRAPRGPAHGARVPARPAAVLMLVVLATANPDKAREIGAILGVASDVAVLAPADRPARGRGDRA